MTSYKKRNTYSNKISKKNFKFSKITRKRYHYKKFRGGSNTRNNEDNNDDNDFNNIAKQKSNRELKQEQKDAKTLATAKAVHRDTDGRTRWMHITNFFVGALLPIFGNIYWANIIRKRTQDKMNVQSYNKLLYRYFLETNRRFNEAYLNETFNVKNICKINETFKRELNINLKKQNRAWNTLISGPITTRIQNIIKNNNFWKKMMKNERGVIASIINGNPIDKEEKNFRKHFIVLLNIIWSFILSRELTIFIPANCRNETLLIKDIVSKYGVDREYPKLDPGSIRKILIKTPLKRNMNIIDFQQMTGTWLNDIILWPKELYSDVQPMAKRVKQRR